MTLEAPTRSDALQGVKIIDCDAHWTEPADLWSARVPAAYKDKVPAQKTVNGRTAWYIDDLMWASTGGNTITQHRQKVIGSHMLQPFDAVDPSAWAVKDRLGILDDMGVWAQILYPNGIGFASNHLFAIEDTDQRQLVLSLYNDHLVDVQHESGDRLFPQAVLPIWDMSLTIKEMTRLLDQGIRGFTLSDKPELLGLAELPEPYFEPMWDLFNESGAVANFHIGAGSSREELESARTSMSRETVHEADSPAGATTIPKVAAPTWRTFGPQRKLAVHAAQMYMSNVRIVANLCNSDLFDRFPELKIVSAESGIGWVPFILEAMEYQYDQMITNDEAALTKRRPAEYFRAHMYVMFWFEEIGAAKLIEDIGVDNVLVETDIPHPTCLYPGAREHFARVLAGLTPEDRRRVLQDNAARLYNIPLE